jgi:glutamine---fructose-6-phosphate transaminase (isomerizing)
VIPALVSRTVAGGADLAEAFRRTVASFEGSVAIGAASADEPGTVLLALRGSGQGVYIGLAEDTFIVASEAYGVVEETAEYIRMDGETPARPDVPASRGQVLVLDGSKAGTLEGIRRIAYDGTEVPVTAGDVITAEVTTRDIDRGDAPHFLLKEISEAPGSFAKTLRGRIVENHGRLATNLTARTLPDGVVARLRAGTIRRVEVIGQGTAAVAGQSLAEVLAYLLQGSPVSVRAITATEYSGFAMTSDLSDTLVVAVSQSGTTTDTNRTVDLARARGAAVIGIVNRRNSDLTDKADGVLYTSDGRDVEMSVASTKAFYAQVAAGVLLACALTEAMDVGDARQRHELLAALRELPEAMRTVLGRREEIGEAARRFAPSKRYWAVVGSGPNKVAAEEVRIKLSELCYKSIACDVTEDKKHIDLSCEPLILVCAAGLQGGTADDVAKEVAIYRAHKASPIVIASEGEERFNAALQVIHVPSVLGRLDFVLAAMVGHLFGYEAARAIDGLAHPLREAREAVERAVGLGGADDAVVDQLRRDLAPVAQRFADGLRAGAYDGHLEASTAVRLVGMLRDATSSQPLESYQASNGKVASPGVLIDDVAAALSRAIDELTRPIDAIKHQAKTVTVGISRSDEGLLGNRLVREVLTTGVARERLSYRVLKELVALDPAVEAVVGFTRYAIDGDPELGAHVSVLDRGGVSRDIPSRVDRVPELRGTKRRVALDHEVLVARGRSDGRTVLLVPEVKGNQATGVTLLHVRFVASMPASVARTVLEGYRGRYQLLADWVTETEVSLRDDLLAGIPTVDLLTLPVSELADHWRS